MKRPNRELKKYIRVDRIVKGRKHSPFLFLALRVYDERRNLWKELI